MTTRRTFTKAMALSPLMLSHVAGALAQAKYPTKQIQMVVGFPPGQASDIGARIMAKHMSDILKQTVFVENKPGAATIIGHQYLKAATPDGYTIGYSSTGPLAINPTLYKKLPYDPQTDFEPIILINHSPVYLVTQRACRSTTYKEAIAYIKANPGKVEYGSGGSGLTVHITMELFKKEAGRRHAACALQGCGADDHRLDRRVACSSPSRSASAIMPFVEVRTGEGCSASRL